MLLMSQTVDEILMARDTLVFLLQGLGNKEIYPSDNEVYFTPLKSSGFYKILPRDSPLYKSVTIWKLASLIGSPCSTAKPEIPRYL